MRFMLIVKSDEKSEAGEPMEEAAGQAMGVYNDSLRNAGVWSAGEGLQASSKGARVHYTSKEPTVTRGPFPNPQDLIAGFWIIEANSLDEAIDWATKAPFGEGAEVEVRTLF
jgi:glutathione S-transferase